MKNIQDGIASPNLNYEQPVKSVTGENTVRVRGKNIFDGKLELGIYSNSTGEKTSSSSTVRSVNYMKVKPNTEYIISTEDTKSIYIHEYNENKTFIQNNTDLSTPKTFTTSQTTEYITLNTRGSENITDTNIKIQVEEKQSGQTEPTSYEPYYTPQEKPLNLGNLEVFEDGYISKENEKWYLNNEWKKTIFDGSENWEVQKNTSPYVYRIVITDYLREENIFNCYANYFIGKNTGPYSNLNSGECRFRYANDTYHYFYVCTDEFETVNDFKTWLSTHNLELVYKLETPSKIEITNPTLINQLEDLQKIQQYDGTTIFEIEGTTGLNPTFELIIETDSITDLYDKVDDLEDTIGDIEDTIGDISDLLDELNGEIVLSGGGNNE